VRDSPVYFKREKKVGGPSYEVSDPNGFGGAVRGCVDLYKAEIYAVEGKTVSRWLFRGIKRTDPVVEVISGGSEKVALWNKIRRLFQGGSQPPVPGICSWSGIVIKGFDDLRNSESPFFWRD